MENQLVTQNQAPMFGLSTFEEALNFASHMAKANLLPAHLKGSPSDCLRVVMQATRWQMDPFAVADKTSIISGKLMYEGQLVSAVVNARGGLAKRLTYDFEGEGDKRVLTVTGTLKGEDTPRTIVLDVPLARKINKNGQMGINPDQQMSYIGARIWARRHTPELMLGVYSPDEIDADEPEKNVTGTAEESTAPERPKATRSPRGAKAAMAAQEPEKPKETVIDTTATHVKDKAPDPEANIDPVIITALADGEVRTFKGCRIVDFKADNFGTVDKPRLAVKAELDGPFKGAVFHRDAAHWINPSDQTKGIAANDVWKKNSWVNVTLSGKMRTTGALANTIAIMVEAIEPSTNLAQESEDIP